MFLFIFTNGIRGPLLASTIPVVAQSFGAQKRAKTTK